MKRWLVVVMMMAACKFDTARSVDCPECVQLNDLTRSSPDQLVRTPRIWKFFDDYAATSPDLCGAVGTTAGTLTPSWERTLISPYARTESASSERVPTRIDVNDGLLALVFSSDALWLLDARDGTPRHVMSSLGHDRGLRVESGARIHLAPDGRGLWLEDSAVEWVDFSTYDIFQGFDLPAWSTPNAASGAVDSDGTVFVVNDRATWALRTDGTKRWEVSSKFARPQLLNDNVLIISANPPRAVVLDASGEVVEHFVMKGRPMERRLKLHDGMLYVLAELPQLSGDENNVGDWLFPGSRRSPKIADGETYENLYSCGYGDLWCFLLKPNKGVLAKLYAFKVEDS